MVDNAVDVVDELVDVMEVAVDDPAAGFSH